MAPLSELETALVIGFAVVAAALLLFIVIIVTVYLCRGRYNTEPQDSATIEDDKKSPGRVKAGNSKKPSALQPVPASYKTSQSSSEPTTPSTTSENLSHISPAYSPRPHLPTMSVDPTSPSLMFPAAHNKYSGMRVGRSAWTAAYLPPSPPPPVQRGDQRLDIYPVSEHSSGFSNKLDEISGADPYVARARAGEYRATPATSEHSSQIQLLDPGSLNDDASYNSGEAFRTPTPVPSAGGANGGRMWPKRTGYAPYSSSAVEAARRRTQELYNARRSQLSASPAAPAAAAGRHGIWSRTDGRPQTGSYVISPRDQQSYYRANETRPSSSAGSASYQHQQQAPGADLSETSMYMDAEEVRSAGDSHSQVFSRPPSSHTHVVEATIENQQPPETPGERHMIGDAFRFLDEFEE